MPQSVAEFVDGVDGVRGGVAEAVGAQFTSVADLSAATSDALTTVKGVGPVLAERILAAARTAVVADHTPAEEPEPDAATRARAAVAQARAGSRPDLDVIEGTGPGDDASSPELPPVVERLATLVGTTIGWGVRLYRSVTQPVHRLLRRG